MSVENTSQEQLLNEYQSLLASIGQDIPVAEPVMNRPTNPFQPTRGMGFVEQIRSVNLEPVEGILTMEGLTNTLLAMQNNGDFNLSPNTSVNTNWFSQDPPIPSNLASTPYNELSNQFQNFLLETGTLTPEQIRTNLSNGQDILRPVIVERSSHEKSLLNIDNTKTQHVIIPTTPKITYSNRYIAVTLRNHYNSSTLIYYPSSYSQYAIEVDYRLLEIAFDEDALNHLISYHGLNKDIMISDWDRYLKTGRDTLNTQKILGELCHRIYENKLHQKYYLLKDDEIKRLDNIKNACERVYPGNWSIEYNCRRELLQESVGAENCSSTWKLYIKFPEVTITNSKKETVKIYDLITVIEFRRDFLKLKNAYIYGAVLGATNKLYKAKFRHSHLPLADIFCHFSSFCLGSSDISSMVMTLANDEFNPYLFETFLYQLDAYVKWESLEGGPYCQMNNINQHNNRQLLTPPIDINNYFKICLEKKFISKSLIAKSENGINLFDIDIEVLDELLLEYLLDYVNKKKGLEDKVFTLINRDRNGDEDYLYASHHVSTNTRSLVNTDREYKLPFRGEELQFKIIKENIEDKLGEICINPLILKYVREQSSRGIQSFFTQNYRVEE